MLTAQLLSVSSRSLSENPLAGASQVILMVKNLPANAEDMRDAGLIPWVGKIPWRRT